MVRSGTAPGPVSVGSNHVIGLLIEEGSGGLCLQLGNAAKNPGGMTNRRSPAIGSGSHPGHGGAHVGAEEEEEV